MSRITSIASIPVNETTRRMNPALFPQIAAGVPVRAVLASPKRLKQDTKPLENELEKAFHAHLLALYPGVKIRAQAKRYRLANGLWYKPDFTAIVAGVECAWEVKGPKAFRGGFENLKMAATQYPEITWTLVWKNDAGGWEEQIILS